MAKSEQILLHNARIYASGEPDYSWMIFCPQNGTITSLGRESPPLCDVTKDRQRDVGGKRVLPGLHEAHIHVSSIGQAQRGLDLHGCASIQEFQNRIQKYVESTPEDTELRGRGWEHDLLGRYPDRDDIDEVCDKRPISLIRACGHIRVVNTVALQLAGITKDTPDPPGGVIDRYPDGHPKAGEPTGILREKAQDLYRSEIIPSDEEIMECIKAGINTCLKNGCTAVHSNEPATWRQWCTLAERGELPIRVFLAAYYTVRDSGNFPTPGERHGDMLSCDRIKLFADGSMGGSTAAISLPYVGTTMQYGVPIYSQEEMTELVRDATARGFRLEIHVIGDRAADLALTALEQAKVKPEMRPILNHCQILRPDLVARMKKQGVVANVQPQFVCTDSTWIHQRVPEELLGYAYAWKSLLQNGIPCAGGSDAPVEAPEPLLGIYDAIYRPVGNRDPDNQKVFRPEECLSVQEALDLYTKGGAYATKRESDLGQLKPGYRADFVVLENGPDVCQHPRHFRQVKVDEVWVDGKLKFSR